MGIDKWEEFTLEAIFDVKYGVNLEVVNCDETTKDDKDAVNFVSRTSGNNGVTTHVKRIPNKKVQEAGVITCAGGGECIIYICAGSTVLQWERLVSTNP